MKKLPYALISILLGISTICRSYMPHWLILLAIATHVITGAIYVISVLKKKTKFFHTYIGWTWMILSIVFAHSFWINPFTEWNGLRLMAYGLCIAVVLVWCWIKDEGTESSRVGFFNVCAAILISLGVAFCPMGINESIVVDHEFFMVEITDKEIDITDTDIFVSDVYMITLGNKDGTLDGFSGGISKEYWDTLQIGDKIPVCEYTGVFGKKFYSLFEDLEPAEDFYGLNEWTREIYKTSNQRKL